MTIRQWSTTASGNANAASINWQEGQAPSTVNNSAREMMAQIRQEYTGERWGWVAHSGTASVASQTVFKISGNQTGDYVANRKVKLTGGTATVYADILSASYTSETTVTIQNASGSLSNSMSIAWLSAVYGNNLPGNVVTGSGTSTFTGVAVFQKSVSFSASVKFGGFVSFSATISTINTIGQTLTTPTINVTSDAEGDTYYRNGSGAFSRLAIGTAGQVLTVNSGATAPEWADASGGVGWTSAGSQATTSGSSAPAITGIPSTASELLVIFHGVTHGGSADMKIRLGDSGGIETTDYLGGDTDGFDFPNVGTTATYGYLHLHSDDGLSWYGVGIAGARDCYGQKTLSGTLTQIQLISANTFSAGSYEVLYR